MQTMNTDQQIFYSTGSHPGPANYFPAHGMEQQFQPRMPTGVAPTHRIQFYPPQMSTAYQPQQNYMYQPVLQTSPFYHAAGTRAPNPNVHVIRPSNENSSGAQSYIQQGGYSAYPNSTMQPTANTFNPQYFAFSAPYATQQASPQYSAVNNPQQAQLVPTAQQLPTDQQHGVSSQSSLAAEKRQRKPLTIVDPSSHKVVEVPAPPSSVNTSTTNEEQRQKDSNIDSTSTNSKASDDVNRTQKQAEFRQQFAKLLHSEVGTEKNANQSSTGDQTDSISTKEQVPISSTSSSRSGSISRTKSPTPLSTHTSKESTSNQSSEQPQPGLPGIRTRSMTEDKTNQEEKRDRTDSQKQSEPEPESIHSKSTSDDTTEELTNEPSSNDQITSDNSTSITQSTSSVPPSESLDESTPTNSNDTESEENPLGKTPSGSKRYSYSIQELLKKRLAASSQKRPSDLVNIDGVTSTPAMRQNSNSSNRGGRGPNISLSLDKPAFSNPSKNPYHRVDQNKIDSTAKLLRDVKSILNKVTPQTYDKLLKQLDELELNSFERLEGMIIIVFSKAVEEPSFCSLYALLCKHFQRKQVTVPSEDGQTVTHYFRQILLTRCQKGFEGDYRQEINYEKRKIDVDAIANEKERKEQSENLEEDLTKAKRRKFGNIYFIGELFKLQMLTDTIMYDCIDYLLRDKADEESLECLCRLLRTIGKELENKAGDKKSPTRKLLEKHYTDLESITHQRQTSARARFMVQDLLDLRKANWVARRAEIKPTTIDEIHEQERVRREQQERDQERDRQQRRDQNRMGNNPQQYTESRGGSRGSGVKQSSNRADDDRPFTAVNSVRQLQSNDKRNQGPVALNLAPQGAWSRGSAVDKKVEDDRSNTGRGGGRQSANPVQQIKKSATSPGTPGYAVQRQPSRELARENSLRDRENAMQSLRKTTSRNGITSPNNVSSTTSREGSRNASRDSSVNERVSNVAAIPPSSTKTPPATPSNDTPFNEEKTQARVRSLIEEYTENYSVSDDRPVKEAMDDLTDFCTPNIEQQTIIVRELFTNILEGKSRARQAVGHLLDIALHQQIISTEGFLSGFKVLIEAVPDYAVDIPLIWQYVGEIIGAFIGAPSSNMLLLKPILQSIPDEKLKQFFQYVIRYAVEFSSKSRIQRFWQASGFSFNDVLKSNLIDSSFTDEYNWLSEPVEEEPTTPSSSNRENLSPHADPQLVKLFKSVNDSATVVDDAEINKYIAEHMDRKDKFFIRNIVLSYLEACLINRGSQKKIQEDIAKKRMKILNEIIEHQSEAEIQAVYAIQNFVDKLEHPPKMAQLLFDIFYDEECVSEDAFFEWLKHPDPSETEGHSVVEMSTKDFFNWLQQADTEAEGEEEEG